MTQSPPSPCTGGRAEYLLPRECTEAWRSWRGGILRGGCPRKDRVSPGPARHPSRVACLPALHIYTAPKNERLSKAKLEDLLGQDSRTFLVGEQVQLIDCGGVGLYAVDFAHDPQARNGSGFLSRLFCRNWSCKRINCSNGLIADWQKGWRAIPINFPGPRMLET